MAKAEKEKKGNRMKRVQNEINWEQRRYEIAKDYYVMACSQAKAHGGETMGDILEAAAWLSAVAADYLIEVLKK